MYPQKIRGGIGHGSINQNMLNNYTNSNSNIYDGEAFHLARKALDNTRKIGDSILINSNKDNDNIVNVLLNDKAIIKTTKTREVIYTIINLLLPQREDDIEIDYYYFKKFSPFINLLMNIYKSSNNNCIENNELIVENKCFDKYDYNISTHIRFYLARLTNSTVQNINSIIKNGKMVINRKRTLAKAKLLCCLYDSN